MTKTKEASRIVYIAVFVLLLILSQAGWLASRLLAGFLAGEMTALSDINMESVLIRWLLIDIFKPLIHFCILSGIWIVTVRCLSGIRASKYLPILWLGFVVKVLIVPMRVYGGFHLEILGYTGSVILESLVPLCHAAFVLLYTWYFKKHQPDRY